MCAEVSVGAASSQPGTMEFGAANHFAFLCCKCATASRASPPVSVANEKPSRKKRMKVDDLPTSLTMSSLIQRECFSSRPLECGHESPKSSRNRRQLEWKDLFSASESASVTLDACDRVYSALFKALFSSLGIHRVPSSTGSNQS